jgi:hypothetical protein
VTIARRYTAYEVRGDTIAGFEQRRQERPSTARATAPRQLPFPTFADPDGTRLLVQVLDGPLTGTWVSPDDPGVRWEPAPEQSPGPTPGPTIGPSASPIRDI